jgi:hypothetical protein
LNAVKAAKNQALFREVNERIRNQAEAFEDVGGNVEYLCECACDDCMVLVRMSPDEYEEIRRDPTHFLVAGPDHVSPALETVFARGQRYFVVEKFGKAGAAASKLDPRGRHAYTPISAVSAAPQQG